MELNENTGQVVLIQVCTAHSNGRLRLNLPIRPELNPV